MNKLICTLFAATLSIGTYSAFAATAGPDEASDLGSKDTPQQKQQTGDSSMKSDGMAHDSMSNDGTTHKRPMKHRRMHHKNTGSTMDSKGTGTTTDNKVQPSEPENATPASPAQQ